jgi:hypothetical protein
VATTLVLILKDYFGLKVKKTLKLDQMTLHLHFILKMFADLSGNLALTLSAQLSFQNV